MTEDVVTLQIRNTPREAYDRFRVASQARGMPYHEYLGALLELHDAMRDLADRDPFTSDVDSATIRSRLIELGLETVRV